MKTVNIKTLLLFAFCLCFIGARLAEAASLATSGTNITVVSKIHWEVDIDRGKGKKKLKAFAATQKIFDRLAALAGKKTACTIVYSYDKDKKRNVISAVT